MLYDDYKGWVFAKNNGGFTFEWSLVKCDNYGNYLAIKDIGFDSNLKFIAPENHEHYKLLLTVIKGDKITTCLTSLNTALLHE